MKIIFIHGMNQQNYDEQSLTQHWLKSFQTGLTNAHSSIDVSSLHIKLPFYGDLLTQHKLYNSLDLNTFLPKSLTHLHLPFHLKHQSLVEEHIPCQAALPIFNPNQAESLTQRIASISELTKDHAFRELSLLMNHYPKIHESFIHQFLIETYLYLSDAGFMHEVHRRIMRDLHPTKEHIIVAHSLGTVIAYNLLHEFTGFKVKRFITLGSPLAFKVVQEKLKPPISRPTQLHGDWLNFYSPIDFLTAFPLCEAPFDFHPPIINQSIQTPINNPHQINGYLEHPAVIQSILDGLMLKK